MCPWCVHLSFPIISLFLLICKVNTNPVRQSLNEFSLHRWSKGSVTSGGLRKLWCELGCWQRAGPILDFHRSNYNAYDWPFYHTTKNHRESSMGRCLPRALPSSPNSFDSYLHGGIPALLQDRILHRRERSRTIIVRIQQIFPLWDRRFIHMVGLHLQCKGLVLVILPNDIRRVPKLLEGMVGSNGLHVFDVLGMFRWGYCHVW